MKDLKKYSERVIQLVKEKNIKTREELNAVKNQVCIEQGVDAPTNPSLFQHSKELKEKFKLKPVKTLSGIASIAVMTKPHICPGKCIYCPSGLDGNKTPKSYTGYEPSTMRAIMFNYDARKIVENRVRQLEFTGHNVEKIELIVMGGTFLSMKKEIQTDFVKECLNGVTEKQCTTLEEAKKEAEKSKKRVIGTTFETRPDFCRKEHINSMLEMTGTRTELGVQVLDNEVLEKINRGHTVEEVERATQELKDSCFKVGYHAMPGLPFSSRKKDLKSFKEMFKKQEFKPDMLKVYPCLVIKGTELHEMWKRGKYEPLNSLEASELIAEAKKYVPKYCRIMRIQRDIPTTVIEAGVKNSNLRQMVQEELKKKGEKCKCIRCREIGLKKYLEEFEEQETKMFHESYKASNGIEEFISIEDKKQEALYGFVRLRIPFNPFRKEISERTGLIRELHVYGNALRIGEKNTKEEQHKGIGKELMKKAEEIAVEKGMEKMVVIAGIGVREYYKNLGYKAEGPYVSKKL